MREDDDDGAEDYQGEGRHIGIGEANGSCVQGLSADGDVSLENDARSKLEYDGSFGGLYERSGPMKRAKFSEEPVVYALRQPPRRLPLPPTRGE